MLSRTWLVVILFILCGVLFAQVDSLSIKADSLSVTHATLAKQISKLG